MPGRSPLVAARAVCLPVLLALAAACGGSSGVRVAAPQPRDSEAAACARLAAALPTDLSARLRHRSTQPGSPYTRAWGAPPITLRCGEPRPGAFHDAYCLTADGVAWGSVDPGADPASYHTRGAGVYVEVTVPQAYSPASVLSAVSPSLSATPCP